MSRYQRRAKVIRSETTASGWYRLELECGHTVLRPRKGRKAAPQNTACEKCALEKTT